MKICIVGKITPIQGGVSRQSFWLVYALAKQGHEVHLVTNANEVEEEYRLIGGKLNNNFENTPLAEVSENLTIHSTKEHFNKSHIPFANPFVTKLTSRAIEVIREHECDLILAYYFEPYGISAYFASKITNVPFGIRHAGSDVGRLMLHSDLSYLYKDMIKSADFIFCSRTTGRRFLEMGVPHDRLSILPMVSYPSHIYSPDRKCLDLEQHVECADNELITTSAKELRNTFPFEHYKKERFTIGIYGKVSESKGTFDLVNALGQLKSQGYLFNFLSLTSGKPAVLDRLRSQILKAGIEDFTIWLPFVPHWNVPEFIKLCDVVTFLERDFSIPIHRPGVAMEVMLCGTCLIVSNEIAEKQSFGDEFKEGKNVLVVDPTNIDALAKKIKFVMTNPEKAIEIGTSGYHLLKSIIPEFDDVTRGISEHITATYERVKLQEIEMSTLEYQSFFNRLYTDEIFRTLHSVSPESAEDFYNLTDEEKSVIKNIDSKMINDYANSLKAKHQLKLKGMYPVISQAMTEDEFSPHYSRYYSLNQAYPGENKIELSNKFGCFMEQSLQSRNNGKAYLSELARFERIRNQVFLSTTQEDSFKFINKRELKSTDVTLDSNFSINPSVTITEFEWDVDKISDFAMRDEHDLLNGQVRKNTTLVIYSVPTEFKPQILKINSATANLIYLIKEHSKVSAVIDAFETQNGLESTSTKILELLSFLHKKSIAKIVETVA